MNSTYNVSLVNAVKIELTRLQQQKSVRISVVQKCFSVLFFKQLFLSTFPKFVNSAHCLLTSACVAPDVLFVTSVVHHRLVLVIVLPEKMGQRYWFWDIGARRGGFVQRGAWAALWTTSIGGLSTMYWGEAQKERYWTQFAASNIYDLCQSQKQAE